MTAAAPARHPRGGRDSEDFAVERPFCNAMPRTVAQMGDALLSGMAPDPQRLRIDAGFCAPETQSGQPPMNSLFTLGCMIDMTSSAPLFEGETIRIEIGIPGARKSGSRRDARIVDSRRRACRQEATPVAERKSPEFMPKRPQLTMAV